MNPWRRNPFFRICIPFILGISSGDNRYLNNSDGVLIIILVVLGMVLAWEKQTIYTRLSSLKGLLLCSALFLLGHSLIILDRHSSTVAINSSPSLAYGEILDTLQTFPFGSVDLVNWTAVQHADDSGSALQVVKPFQCRVFIPVISRITAPGHNILAAVSWSAPGTPVYQGAFNERSFLRSKGEYVKARADSLLWIGNATEVQVPDPVTATVQRSRRVIRHALSLYIPDTAYVSIMKALLIGDRKEMPDHIRNKIAGAGLAHVLAVSGLHVGIVFWILNGIFQLVFTPRFRERVAPPLLILAIGWYALLTGSSPSVVRAALMIALVLIARMAGSKGPVINTVLFTGFVMLCARPYLLFNLGFQLSFLAVMGILWIYPQFKRWYYPKCFVARKVTDVLYVSLAAQLSTCLLTMTHFGQFPTYFLVANLFITPLLILSLYTGILLIICHSAGVFLLSGYMGKAIVVLMDLSMQGISLLEQLPGYLIKDIFIPVYAVIPGCLFIGLTAGALFYKQPKLLVLAIIPLVYLLGGELRLARAYQDSAEIIVLKKGPNEGLVIRASRSAVCVHGAQEKDTVQEFKEQITRYMKDRRIPKTKRAASTSTIRIASAELGRSLQLDNDTMLILLGMYPSVPERTAKHEYVVEYIPGDQLHEIDPDRIQQVDLILLQNKIAGYRMETFRARLQSHGFSGKIAMIR